MDPRDHTHVPVGTVHDLITDSPVTVTRDYETAGIPAMTLNRAGLAQLRKILDDADRDMAACEAQMAEEADDGGPDVTGLCHFHGGSRDESQCVQCEADEQAAAVAILAEAIRTGTPVVVTDGEAYVCTYYRGSGDDCQTCGAPASDHQHGTYIVDLSDDAEASRT